MLTDKTQSAGSRAAVANSLWGPCLLGHSPNQTTDQMYPVSTLPVSPAGLSSS